jgi:PHP family Zn ribbon phosphoesterase
MDLLILQWIGLEGHLCIATNKSLKIRRKKMSRKVNKAILAGLVIGFSIIGTGCTIPHYSRSVSRSYDSNGNLTGTVVVESVDQMDPNSKPVLDVLENQTYKK